RCGAIGQDRVPPRLFTGRRCGGIAPAVMTDNRAPAAGESLLGALAIAARHRGIHLSPAQLRRDHRIAADGPAPAELLQIARAAGLRAVPTRLSFDDLMQLGRALPTILLLTNGCAMVVLRAEAKAQPPHVVVQD